MMIPSQIQIAMFNVRQGEWTMNDFKNCVTALIIDSCDLNEIQAAICYNHGKAYCADMETIWYSTVRYAEFAKTILKNV